MKSAEEISDELGQWEATFPNRSPEDVLTLMDSKNNATADLQAQVEQLRTQIEELLKHQNGYRNLHDQLRTTLEKCVVALESEPFHSWRVKEAINTAKPLLNKP